jgi:hypothetical protein
MANMRRKNKRINGDYENKDKKPRCKGKGKELIEVDSEYHKSDQFDNFI